MTPPDHTPDRIVAALDRHVVGQAGAKRTLALAACRRERRLASGGSRRAGDGPDHVLLIGGTGTGKSELVRRLADEIRAPWIEADVTSLTDRRSPPAASTLIELLVGAGIESARADLSRELEQIARERAVEILVDSLVPAGETSGGTSATSPGPGLSPASIMNLLVERTARTLTTPAVHDPRSRAPDPAREAVREALRSGRLDDREVIVELEEGPPRPLDSRPPGSEAKIAPPVAPAGEPDLEERLRHLLDRALPGRRQSRRMTVAEALPRVTNDQIASLLDERRLAREGLERAERLGIVLLDGLDALRTPGAAGSGPADRSRPGRQRRLLALLDGAPASTGHGPVRTDGILFVGTGAFPEGPEGSLIPDLLGRFPARVRVDRLDRRALRDVMAARAGSFEGAVGDLVETGGVPIRLSEDAVEALADLAAEENRKEPDLGAYRLFTLLRALLEDLVFDPPPPEAGERILGGDEVRRRIGFRSPEAADVGGIHE